MELGMEMAPAPPRETPTGVRFLQSLEWGVLPEINPESIPPPPERSPTKSSSSPDVESEGLEIRVVPPSLIV